MIHLSKSDFKVARTCATKLFYKKSKFPSNLDADPYLEFLADGGYMVETIAKLLFPEGREIDFSSPEKALQETTTALQNKDVTLFEATLVFGQLLARVDILEKKGNRFRLIEVKAKSFNSQTDVPSPFRGKKGDISSKWRPYLEDVTFQTYILKSLFPDAIVTSCLCIVDKSTICLDGMSFENFEISPRSKGTDAKAFDRPEVKFNGNLETLRKEPFVRIIDVTSEVKELTPEVVAEAARFASSLTGGTPERIIPELGVKCKKCEYRFAQPSIPEKHGFGDCWGDLATPRPHLLDLYRIDLLGTKGTIATKMIGEGKCSIEDVSIADLRPTTGTRQTIQVEHTKAGTEFIAPELRRILESCAYPLQFIDFEASRLAVPYHPGMHPYEQVAFQWSCHTVPARGAQVEHQEWINIDEGFPNFEFARSLKRALGSQGTVFVWSPFEKSALSEVRKQLDTYQEKDEALAAWLDSMIADTAPLVDLCNLAKDHYFHPRMGGSLSIKHVLPAVWFQDEQIRNHRWFSAYHKVKDGQTLDPYESLDRLPFGDVEGEMAEAVQEGTGAMRTYQEMMFGIRRSDASFRNAQKQLLLNYCKLDTAAMVMVWMHWTGAYT